MKKSSSFVSDLVDLLWLWGCPKNHNLLIDNNPTVFNGWSSKLSGCTVWALCLTIRSSINPQLLGVATFLSVLFQPDWSSVSVPWLALGELAMLCPWGEWCVLWGVYTRLMHSHCRSVPVQLAALSLSASVCLSLPVPTCLCPRLTQVKMKP